MVSDPETSSVVRALFALNTHTRKSCGNVGVDVRRVLDMVTYMLMVRRARVRAATLGMACA